MHTALLLELERLTLWKSVPLCMMATYEWVQVTRLWNPIHVCVGKERREKYIFPSQKMIVKTTVRPRWQDVIFYFLHENISIWAQNWKEQKRIRKNLTAFSMHLHTCMGRLSFLFLFKLSQEMLHYSKRWNVEHW